jgi:LacI family transcriptional regulator
MVGLIVPDIGNPFFPEITKSFQDAARLSGLETIVMNTNYDLQRTRDTVDRLVSLQVPGAAFLTSQVDPAIRLALSAKGHGIQAAVAHLLELGHRRIGFIGGPANGAAAKLRKFAFLDCASSRTDIEVRVVDSDFSVQGGYFSCSKLLNDFPATAVMAANDMMAIGAMHCAYDRKIAVPSEISIVGFDDITFAQFTQPALTTVAVPRQDIGRLAFQSLWSLVSDSSRAGMEYEVKTGLVVRQTTAPPGR